MTQRILTKLDEHLGKNDYESAEKHLLFWLSQAEAENNGRIILLVCNELMGLYRKLGKKENALSFAEKALDEIEKMNISDNVGAATTYLNSATVYKAFGMPEKSLLLFEKARNIYENQLDSSDKRLGGLYNNMALTLVDLKHFDEAYALYEKALTVMNKNEGTKPETAVTYLNMASAFEAEKGIENAEADISALLEKATVLLDEAISETDGNYAFVCEKCAPVFGYYGYFFYEKELKNRARRIYERT